MDFEEFLKLVRHKEKKAASDKFSDPDLEIFKMFDKDGSGSLSSNEWLSVRKILKNKIMIIIYFALGYEPDGPEDHPR